MDLTPYYVRIACKFPEFPNSDTHKNRAGTESGFELTGKTEPTYEFQRNGMTHVSVESCERIDADERVTRRLVSIPWILAVLAVLLALVTGSESFGIFGPAEMFLVAVPYKI
ncbi:MAG: hypothetical protein HXY34_13365, partial [Candidatus Thorarchaeota archaeon]|nr:hypothetical protein [Candidatus Thorarchaeota archaeon]